MTLYGLYIRDVAAGDLVWFRTEQSLEPGSYKCGRVRSDSANVFIAESIPALILQVGPRLDEVERLAKSNSGPQATSSEAEKHAATEMTDGLVERLTETSTIWVTEPRWLSRLRPLVRTGS